MAIRLTRIYTRTGDTGDTALVGGRRVPKDAARIEAYGTVDELNSVIGLARVFNGLRAAPLTLSATQAAHTMASISELLASLFAPCNPVRLTSMSARRTWLRSSPSCSRAAAASAASSTRRAPCAAAPSGASWRSRASSR